MLSALDVITKDRNRITFKGYQNLLQQNIKEYKPTKDIDVRVLINISIGRNSKNKSKVRRKASTSHGINAISNIYEN